MNLVRNDDRFYEEYDETGQPKPAGWCFLQADDGEDEEMSDGDEDYHIEEDDEDDSDEDDDEDDDESEEDNDDHEDVADWYNLYDHRLHLLIDAYIGNQWTPKATNSPRHDVISGHPGSQ